MLKPSEFEVMHFILKVCVWLHEGFHVNPASLHGYGLCCRIFGPNHPDDVTSRSKFLNPSDTGRPQPRQQTTADAMAHAAAVAVAVHPVPAAGQRVQSVTVIIDYNSLATATSRLNDDSASNVEKGTQPKWDLKNETIVEWQHMVEIWADSHDIRHLLEQPPVANPVQLRKHEIAKRIVLLTLPNHDRACVRGSVKLYEIWSKLLAKHMPSIDAGARKLWNKFSAMCRAGRPMVEHVNECMMPETSWLRWVRQCQTSSLLTTLSM